MSNLSSFVHRSSLTLAAIINQLFCQSISHSHYRLLYFLNSILDKTLHGTISEIVYIDQRQRSEDVDHLETQLHIKARTLKAEHLDVYLFVKHESFSNSFQLFEQSSTYNQHSVHAPFHLNKKTYFIKIADFNLLQDNPQYHSVYHYEDIEAHDMLKEVEELHYLELPKFNERVFDSPLKRWMALFILIQDPTNFDLPLPKSLQKDALIYESYQLILNQQSSQHQEQMHTAALNKYKHEQKLLKLGKQAGEWLERRRIATKMISNGYKYQAIMTLTDVTENQLDQFAVDCYRVPPEKSRFNLCKENPSDD